MNIFLDDKRVAPEGFVHVRSVAECQAMMEINPIDILCIDHGLGLNQPTGYDLVKWMIAHGRYPRRIHLHSGSHLNRRMMKQALVVAIQAAHLETEVYDTPYQE